MYSPGSSSAGPQPRITGTLCYLLSVVTGVLFLVIEKENRFVRFHAWQSILLFIAYIGLYTVVGMLGSILGILPIIGEPLWFVSQFINQILSFGMGAATVVLMFHSYKEERYKLPYLGDVAERNAYS